MKLILLVVILSFSFFISANTVFEIPRSSVVEINDLETDRIYPLFIKLPRTYKSKPDKHYPVIYLMDGSYAFQVVSGSTRFPMNSGVMEEAIIVGISYSKGSKGSSSRIRDYTPSKAPDWKLETGNAAQHTKLIREVIFPYVENNYRVKKGQRTFVGNSLGGLLGAYILFNTPDMFDSYILGSPSVWFNNKDILSSSVVTTNRQTKVYLSVGGKERVEFGEQRDMVVGAEELAKKITRQGGKSLMLKLSIIEGATHATAFPTTAIQGLDWLYGK